MNDVETARELGQLQERVRGLDSKFGSLETKIDSLVSKLDDLNALAERGKGAYWAAICIASLVGAVVTWIIKHIVAGRAP